VAHIPVSNEEVRSVREAMRNLSALLDQLEQGDPEKLVLFQNSRIRAVLLSPERYAELIGAVRDDAG
jgi:hypothetical protein